MFIRYPGSKAKLRKKIMAVFPDDMVFQLWSKPFTYYCEPFFGSGAIGWELISGLIVKNTTVVINDLDSGISDLWKTVRDSCQELESRVMQFKPTAEAFYSFKNADGQPGVDPVARGFRKLALHQMSFSGLGAMSGGPLGGREGRSEYNPCCRWNPITIVKKIRRCRKLMRGCKDFIVLNKDFEEVLSQIPAHGFAYLDPPYYVQGINLYKYCMSDADHRRLAECLRHAEYRWTLSYDDHPRIRELYAWADIGDFEMTPTMQTARGKRRKNQEIVIRNKGW